MSGEWRSTIQEGRHILIFGGVHAQEIPGGKPEIRSLPHDLVTGRIPHTGSRQCVSGEAPSRSQAAVLPAVVQGLDSSPSSHHALSDTQPYLPFSLPKATKPSVPRTEAETQEHTLPIPVQAHLSLLHAKAPEAWQAPSLSEFRPCPSSLFLAPGA